jgi:hypothetical protein
MPRGEKRLADVIGAAVMVAKIATGEVAPVRQGVLWVPDLLNEGRDCLETAGILLREYGPFY